MSKSAFPMCHAGRLCAAVLSGLALCAPAYAQFAAAVTPPRFEIGVEPGQVSRQVMEITHAIPGTGSYRVYTADWHLDAGGALTFYDALQPGSCRPWVAIERKEVNVAQGARVRYRFEVAAPADTAPRECRFALMIESKPQEVQANASASFPMSGRIAVIVYARVGTAKAVLEAGEASVAAFDGRATPMLMVRNTGNATARLTGVLKGTDATGATIEFTPESVPILPDTTRRIALQAYEPGPRTATSVPPPFKWPLALRGVLEYGLDAASRIDVNRNIAERPTQ